MNDMSAVAHERLIAQLGEALFNQPGLDLIEIANRCNRMAAKAGSGLLVADHLPSYTPSHMAASFRAGQNTERMQDKPEAVRLRDELRERTPVDYAIEHAGYLVTAANQVIEARNELDALMMRQDEGGDVGDDEMQAAQEAVGDASHVLRLAIHEFEKRRDRALAATGKQQVGEVVEDDRFPGGFEDAIAYVNKLEDLAEDLHEQVIGCRSDGGDGASTLMQLVLSELKEKSAQVGEVQGGELGPLRMMQNAHAALIDQADTLLAEGVKQFNAALAARQPVGQDPSAWLIHWSHSSFAEPEATTRASRAEAVGMLTDPPRIDPLYAAPPAQAVDLGQFRESVKQAFLREDDAYQRGFITADYYAKAEDKRDRLLALIDGQAVQS